MARTNIQQLGLLCLYGKIVARRDRFVIDQQSHRIPEKVISIATRLARNNATIYNI